MGMTRLSKFETARAVLVKDNPFYACIVLSTPFVEERSILTACTDMQKVYYNPDFIESLDVPTVIFVIIHEILHIILKHGFRRGSRNPEKWNYAADFAINLMAKQDGFKVWQHALLDTKYGGMSAEQIYEKLPDPPPQSGGGGGGQGGDDDGYQMGPGQGGMDGDLRPLPKGVEKSEVETKINRTIAQATAVAKMRGKMPGSLSTIIDTIYEEPIHGIRCCSTT